MIKQEEDKLEEFLQKRRELEDRLKEKEDRIKNLNQMIQMFEVADPMSKQEIMAFSHKESDDYDDEDEEYFGEGKKFSKAQFLMQ